MNRAWPVLVVVLLIAVAALGYLLYARSGPVAPAPPGEPAIAANPQPSAPSASTPATTEPAPSTAGTGSPAAGGEASPSPAPSQPEPADTPPSEPASPPAPQPVAECLGSAPVPASTFVAGDADASYCGTGHLVPGSGHGEADAIDWAPGMRFPLDRAPAYANSQVWGVGGMSGPPGGQGDRRNYSYPWHDNFCETRGYSTLMCPSGRGHQGQDIRPAECCDAQGHLLQDTFAVDAVESGRISSIGTYTVYLVGDSGRLYRYLHMDMKKLKVAVGDRVTRGQAIGYVSNAFGNSVTTFHLHFEIKAPVSRNGTTVYTWVSPYPSLVASYANLLAGHP